MLPRSEIQKLIGSSTVIVLLVLLLAANFSVCFVLSPESAEKSCYDAIFREYNGSPEAVDEYYSSLLSLKEEYDRLYFESIKAGDEIEVEEKYPCKYSGGPELNDYYLLSNFYTKLLKSDKKFESDINRVITTVRQTQSEILGYNGLDQSSYAYKKQAAMEKHYTDILERTEIIKEYPSGWDTFFNYRISDIFLLIIAILLGTSAFLSEQNGSAQIVYPTKNGRTLTALWKLGALTVTLTAAVVLFDLGSLLAVLLRTGLSDPQNALGAFEVFRYVPYSARVCGYLVFFELSRALAFCGIALCVAALSLIVRSKLVCFAASVAFVGGEYVLYFITENEALKFINLAGLCNPSEMLTRFRSLDIFGAVIEFPAIYAVITAVLIACGAAASVLIYSRRQVLMGKTKSFLWLGKLKGLVSFDSKPRLSKKSTSLLSYEFVKTFKSALNIAVIAALIIAKIFLSSAEFGVVHNYDNAVYLTYMETLAGELTDEKLEFVKAERQYIDGTLAKEKPNKALFTEGKLSYAEYSAYLKELDYAKTHTEMLGKLEHQIEYVGRVSNENETAQLIYDPDWLRVINASPDLILILLLIFLFSGTVADEYHKPYGAYPISSVIKCTKKGRERLFSKKALFVALTSLGVSAVFVVIDAYFINSNLILPQSAAPLISVEAFETTANGLKIYEYLLLTLAAKLLTALFLSLAAFAFGEFVRNKVAVMAAVIGAVCLPALGNALGVAAFGYFDLSAALGLTDMYLSGFSLLFYPIFAALVAVAVLLSRKKYTKY